MTETLWPGGPAVHPVASVFPMIEGTEFEEFAADIKEKGLIEPIWLMPDGAVLDGRNRWLACRQVGVEPTFRTYDGDDPIGFAVSLNRKRRHLDESQRAWVAQKIANLSWGGDRTSEQSTQGYFAPAVTIDDAARMMNVGRMSVIRARVIDREGAENVQKAVERGEIKVRPAATAVKNINAEAGGVEEGKKRQETMTLAQIREAAKKDAEEELVQDALDAEAAGEGNVVTGFIIAHRRRPNEHEARNLALMSGKTVTDSNGIIRTPATREESENRRDMNRPVGPLEDAIEILLENDPAHLAAAVPRFARKRFAERLAAASPRLADILAILEQEAVA